jgi:hypothetical protein
LLFVLCLVLMPASASRAAEVESFPHRPLTIVVPAAPDSLPDALMRLVARPLAMTAGQPVTVNDLPGGDGAAGVDTVRRAAADGHTLLAITSRTPVPGGVFRPVILVARDDAVNDWHGLVVPAATPAAIVERLNALIDEVLRRPEVANALRRAALQPAGGAPTLIQGLGAPAAAGPSSAPRPAASAPGGRAAPIDARIVFDGLGDPVVKIQNLGDWTVWGSYTKVDCVNTRFGCEGQSTPHPWGPIGPREATMTAGYAVYPEDPCQPYSVREIVVNWKYVERVNGKAVERTGVTRAPGFGARMGAQDECAAKKKTTGASPSPAASMSATPSSSVAGSRPATPATATTSASPAPSAPANACGTSGQILFVRAPSDIPAQCQKGRADNWAQSHADSGVAAQELCSKAVVPYDNGNRIPANQIRNLSACFCIGTPGSSPSAASAKCWTFYDRVY